MTVTANRTLTTDELSYAVPLIGIECTAQEIYINRFPETTAASTKGIYILIV